MEGYEYMTLKDNKRIRIHDTEEQWKDTNNPQTDGHYFLPDTFYEHTFRLTIPFTQPNAFKIVVVRASDLRPPVSNYTGRHETNLRQEWNSLFTGRLETARPRVLARIHAVTREIYDALDPPLSTIRDVTLTTGMASHSLTMAAEEMIFPSTRYSASNSF
ncbi:hypothetical protein CDAR_277901 [Caerostris darwini]|uniref:Uncharacterized protein n=1 Tax=Caerostris darwini TaxID=1538125 RepID=A0AAV4PGN1_9ARAC|nr:hypothetical protein CDAR_277901 [Caerostris darwini]